MIDGLAASVALLAATVAADLGRPLTALRVDGGLTRSRVLLQAQADLLQLPVEVYEVPDATALGVAALARLGTGEASSAGGGGRPGGSRDRGRAANRRGRGGRAAGGVRRRAAGGPGGVAVTAGPDREAADVVVIGAGVVGAAIARELSRYQLTVVLADAANDVGTGTTKANTAILHTGFDAVPGSLESRLLRRGSALLTDYARRAGIPVERTGALLVAWTAEQEARAARDHRAGQAKRLRPRSARSPWPSSTSGSRSWDRARWPPWRFRTRASSARGPRRWPTPPRRCAAGVRLMLGTPVTGAQAWGGRAGRTRALLSTTRGPLRGRWRGQRGRAGQRPGRRDARRRRRFTIRPRRGELIVFDKLARPLLSVDPAAGADRADQGRAGRARPCTATCCSGPTAEDVDDRGRHRDDRGRAGRR